MSERKVEWVMWGGLLATILVLLAAFLLYPLIKAHPLPDLGTMSDFSLVDQNNKTVTFSSLRGKVWLADVIFTRCAGQCPIMSSHMRDIEDALSPDLPITLVSFTTDAEFDTPTVLKQYASRYNARDDRWLFLTGSKTALRDAEGKGLKLSVVDKAAGEQENAADLFIHSQKLVVIDQSGHIRGYFDGDTSEGASQAAAAAKALARQ